MLSTKKLLTAVLLTAGLTLTACAPSSEPAAGTGTSASPAAMDIGIV